MNIKKIEQLSVVECSYTDFHYDKNGNKQRCWVVDPDDRSVIHSEVERWNGKHDDFRVCGVYHKAEVPFEITEVDYTSKEEIPAHEGFMNAISDTCYEAMKDGNPMLVTGATCVYAPGIIGGIQRAVGTDKKIGVIWLDAHSDMSTPDTMRDVAPVSESSNLIVQGMPLTISLGMCLDNIRNAAGLERPIDDKNVLLTDIRSTYECALENVEKTEVNVLDKHAFRNPQKWKEAVEELASKVDVIYLHVDADILHDKYLSEMLRTLMVDPDGHEPDVVTNNLKTVLETGKVRAFTYANTYWDDVSDNERLIYPSLRIVGESLESWEQYPVESN